ncbi:Npun_F0813 family protein [Mastigocladopsis repens]|uniref:Npun_F0813 family protein n=1 Tax=Mastigocladopsis repens TaxID=221287 RepID=UPI00031FB98B|nr:Npun_F0813 family protein [Mastigocladopsis repens]
MFILKRQDVEISTIQHPKQDQLLQILYYQGQTFCLISVFKANQEEEAKALWRELTDNRGKACVLLEEPARYSVWRKVRLKQIGCDTGNPSRTRILTQACLLLLQAVYMDVEDFLGSRQAALFEKDIAQVLQQWQIPQLSSPKLVKNLLNMDLQQVSQIPSWQEHHIITLLQELHRLAKAYFGNTNFAEQVVDRLQDMPEGERDLFISWLNLSSLSKLWH